MNSRILTLFSGFVLFIAAVALIQYCSVDEYESTFDLTTNNNNLKIVNALIQTSTQSVSANFDKTYPFSYITNPEYEICEPNIITDLTLLAFVPSSVDNFNTRRVLRNTWANPIFYDNQKFRVVFMVGQSTNETVNEMVKQEMKIHGDIVQENFLDSYRNLTLKTLMGLRWSSTYCSNAKFILKIDDDVIMNTKYLLNYLEENMNISKSFICYNLINSTVDRNQNAKWYMSYDEYNLDILPNYCQGSAYMLTNDITSMLVENSFKIKRIYLEDAYLGILAKYLNITIINIWDRYLADKGYVYDDLKNLNIEDIFFVYALDVFDYFSLWNDYFASIAMNLY